MRHSVRRLMAGSRRLPSSSFRIRRRPYLRPRPPSSPLAVSFSTTTTAPVPSFVDPALEWGRNNPQVAEQCLAIPPLPPPPTHTNTSSSIGNAFQAIHSLQEYWTWRQWKFPLANTNSTSRNDLPLAQALVSHVLSAPLTVASFHRALAQQARWNASSSKTARNPQGTMRYHWCCVGARAEATLPFDFWKEYLIAVSHFDHSLVSTQTDDNVNDTNASTPPSPPPSLDITIDFVGPDIHPQMPSTTLTYGDSKLHLNWLYRGFLHDYVTPNTSRLLGWTGYILLNPGVGHAHLKRNWEPTLDFLLLDQKDNLPILMTAHSDLDAQRDYAVLTDEYALEECHPPVVNPFASWVTYEDPFDASHKVQPNHSVMFLPSNNT